MNRGLPGFLLWPELPQGELSRLVDWMRKREPRIAVLRHGDLRKGMGWSLLFSVSLCRRCQVLGGSSWRWGPLERQGPASLGHFPFLFLAPSLQPLTSSSFSLQMGPR